MCLTVFCTREREMSQPKYHWVELKYLGAIQNRLMFFPNMHRHLLGNCRVSMLVRKALYLFTIYSDMFANIRNVQILILSRKRHSLEISYLQKIIIEI